MKISHKILPSLVVNLPRYQDKTQKQETERLKEIRENKLEKQCRTKKGSKGLLGAMAVLVVTGFICVVMDAAVIKTLNEFGSRTVLQLYAFIVGTVTTSVYDIPAY